VDFNEILCGGDAFEGTTMQHATVIFNCIASAILKWLTFKVLRWLQCLHHSALLSNRLGFVSIADVTMETMACGLL
jgi:hypothetical protein